jgi:FimV-like protein
MPSVEAVEDISLASARREVVAQQERLAASRAEARATSPAAPVLVQENAPPAPAEEPAAPTPRAPTPAETVEASAEPTEEAEATAPEPAMAEEMPEEAAVASEEPRDQLELVPPSSSTPSESAEAAEGAADGAETGGAEQLRESLARTEEELINQRQQNDYLEERIRELESRLQEAEKEGVSDADLANMQDRLREQRQASPAGSDQPWYTRTMVWLLVVLVLVVALVGWLFSRRGRSHDLGGLAPKPKDSLEEIRGEAEDVLRTLGDEPAAESLAEEPPQEPAREPVQEPDDDTETKVVQFPGGDEDAEVLDEESSDPEIQLDLARAYISMGDKEAARVILEEVISNGTETQRTEGRKMLDLLRSP